MKNANFQDVTAGSEFTPSAERHNALNRLLREHNRMQGAVPGETSRRNSGTITVFNGSGNTLVRGSVLVMDGVFNCSADGALPDGIPVPRVREANSTEDAGRALCIAFSRIEPGQYGQAVVSGAAFAFADISDETHSFADVDYEAGALRSAKESGFPILWKAEPAGSGIACAVFLSGGSGNTFVYDGPFAVSATYDEEGNTKLHVNSGWALVNGKFFPVAEKNSLTPQAGFLCVHAEVDPESASIPEPEIVFAEPDVNNYPIAEVSETDGGAFAIMQFYSQVAVFQIVKPCPLAEF